MWKYTPSVGWERTGVDEPSTTNNQPGSREYSLSQYNQSSAQPDIVNQKMRQFAVQVHELSKQEQKEHRKSVKSSSSQPIDPTSPRASASSAAVGSTSPRSTARGSIAIAGSTSPRSTAASIAIAGSTSPRSTAASTAIAGSTSPRSIAASTSGATAASVASPRSSALISPRASVVSPCSPPAAPAPPDSTVESKEATVAPARVGRRGRAPSGRSAERTNRTSSMPPVDKVQRMLHQNMIMARVMSPRSHSPDSAQASPPVLPTPPPPLPASASTERLHSSALTLHSDDLHPRLHPDDIKSVRPHRGRSASMDRGYEKLAEVLMDFNTFDDETTETTGVSSANPKMAGRLSISSRSALVDPGVGRSDDMFAQKMRQYASRVLFVERAAPPRWGNRTHSMVLPQHHSSIAESPSKPANS